MCSSDEGRAAAVALGCVGLGLRGFAEGPPGSSNFLGKWSNGFESLATLRDVFNVP